jgi:hypothetical protein
MSLQDCSRNMGTLSELVSEIRPFCCRLLTTVSGPKDILVAEKHGVQKILVRDDLQKSPVYEAARPYPEVSNLITERDKKAYKHKVCVAYC